MDSSEETDVTVVVRTPDQSSNDFIIECNDQWTVKNIKTHIYKCYPTKPDEKHQKIIYYGKLLSDNMVLKNVFHEQEDKRYIVHLVCIKTAESVKSSLAATATLPQPTAAPSSSSVNSTSSSATDSETDGLRQRPATSSSYNPYTYPYNYGGYQMQYNGNVPSSSYYQAYWMQQYYAQQMAQYAQYSNQQLTTTPNAVNPAPVVNLAAPPPVVVPNVNIANNAQPAQNNVRMNAGVGPAIDDDEDDQMNRDWLDWSYMFFRATVLISIVYFYSSMNRFMIVIGFISFFYLYRQRQQTRQRQLAAEEAAAAAQEAAAAAAQETTETPADHTDGQQETEESPVIQQDETADGEQRAETQETAAGDATQPSPPQPGIFATAWIFFSSFFTSLIPHEPPPANLN